MPRIYENVDATPAQSTGYIWLHLPGGNAYPFTPGEFARSKERSRHPGNVAETAHFTRGFHRRAASRLWLAAIAGAIVGIIAMRLVGCTAPPDADRYVVSIVELDSLGRPLYAQGPLDVIDPVTGERMEIPRGSVAAWDYSRADVACTERID